MPTPKRKNARPYTKYTPEQRRQYLDALAASGLSVEVWCQQEGNPASSCIYNWKRKGIDDKPRVYHPPRPKVIATIEAPEVPNEPATFKRRFLAWHDRNEIAVRLTLDLTLITLLLWRLAEGWN